MPSLSVDGSVFNKETGRRIAAVLPVHVFGHPAAVDQLRVVADTWGLPMVEDAAEALAQVGGAGTIAVHLVL